MMANCNPRGIVPIRGVKKPPYLQVNIWCKIHDQHMIQILWRHKKNIHTWCNLSWQDQQTVFFKRIINLFNKPFETSHIECDKPQSTFFALLFIFWNRESVYCKWWRACGKGNSVHLLSAFKKPLSDGYRGFPNHFQSFPIICSFVCSYVSKLPVPKQTVVTCLNDFQAYGCQS